jgi:hypothetical protein
MVTKRRGINMSKPKMPITPALKRSILTEMKKEFPDLKPGRQRPRNPQEKEVLLRWEKERGGKKIGTI